MDDYGLTQLVAPVGELVPLQELRAWLRVEHAADDSLIYALGSAAAELLGAQHDRSLLTATWRLTLPGFSAERIRLPRGPARSVSQVQYRDGGGAWQTLAPSAYALTGRDPAEVEATGAWPATYPAADAVRIDYVAGLMVFPEAVKLAAKVCVASWYANRGDGQDSPTLDVPAAATALMRAVSPGGYP